MVFATGVSGELGISPRHAPLITQLKPGPVRVQQPNGEEAFFFVGGGILEVQPHMSPCWPTRPCVVMISMKPRPGAKAEAERELPTVPVKWK